MMPIFQAGMTMSAVRYLAYEHERRGREPVPCMGRFLHPRGGSIGNLGQGRALSGDENTSRGRPPLARTAEDMIEHQSADDRRKISASLDEARLRQQAIGVRLRQMFDEVVNEPIPDEFLDILREADKRTPENR